MGLVAWTEGGAGGEGGVPYEDGKFLAETSAGRTEESSSEGRQVGVFTVVDSCWQLCGY